MAYATLNKKGHDPKILDLRGHSDFTDYFVIVSGNTEIQVRAIVQEIERACYEQKISIQHTEGQHAGSWVLMDLGSVVVHIFRDAERRFYDLETLWHRAKIVSLPQL